MTPEEFAERFPRLYHMADENAWPGIQRHGLLSTTALLDLFEIRGERRHAIESCHRPVPIPIEHGRHGRATVRDQKPMSEGALRKCLLRMSPRRWYETLNGKVFFWLTAERLTRLLSARAYRRNIHCVLTMETLPLFCKHVGRITLSPINSGSTIYRPRPRGATTFLPISKYPFDEWARRRGPLKAVAELAVEYSLPDARKFVIRAEKRRADHVIELLYER